MLFIDLDETLVRTQRLGSFRDRDNIITHDKAKFQVKVSGGVYDVHVRPDIYRLWWSNLPFVIFSAGDRDYVKAIAKELRDKIKLNVRGWMHRYDMADVGPNEPITHELSVLIDERHLTDPIVRYKIARIPNGVFIRIDPWDMGSNRELMLQRAPTSRPLRLVLRMTRDILGINERMIPRTLKANLTRSFTEQN